MGFFYLDAHGWFRVWGLGGRILLLGGSWVVVRAVF